MSLIPWRQKRREVDPTEASPLTALRSEVDRLFDTFLREPFGAIEWPFGAQGKWMPTVDIAENDEEVTVRAEVPGIDPKDLDVSVTGSQLVLSGQKKEAKEQREKDFYHTESRFGSFRRFVQLPEGVDTEHVDAQYANGVLTLRMKKAQAAASKRIEVKVKQ